MIKSQYQNIIQDVITKCQEYLDKKISIQTLQAYIQNAEQQIISLEEKKICEYLQNIEAEIELILFTVNKEDQEQKFNSLAKRLLKKLKEVLSN